jgi:hypothetical protein
MHVEVKAIEVRRPWRRAKRPASRSQTLFPDYLSRLNALAERHEVKPATLKDLIEDAFGTCDNPPAEQEAKHAMMKLARMRVGPCEINWLFQYHIQAEPEIK